VAAAALIRFNMTSFSCWKDLWCMGSMTGHVVRAGVAHVVFHLIYSLAGGWGRKGRTQKKTENQVRFGKTRGYDADEVGTRNKGFHCVVVRECRFFQVESSEMIDSSTATGRRAQKWNA
jgi:hypothetical protein